MKNFVTSAIEEIDTLEKERPTAAKLDAAFLKAKDAVLDIASVVRLTEAGRSRDFIAAELRRTGRWVWKVQYLLHLTNNTDGKVNGQNASALRLL